ncbi:uncharacterized protein E0L32_001428 [Thyridium curvatum]|uniref:Zn(2)-C6 fungal-type domain-containing protein n=1 Tax=Thyridium curvatum TaxID=1093900 RepID=A0A507AZF2_9PEZI|nr:uncharacterized protein E0L32_001428 [Thyridium curvatum]TPX10231.1 hypothetical protein E0L32_001428 [Thyridium curvatum]
MGEVSDAMSENENEYDENGTIHKDDDDTMGDLKTEGADGTEEVKKKYDPKDPLRPRRKKARRACFACQRAHLTCGDERPCQRCIKRGLADACQDGVRKKAKYLHDAPPEALRPVLGPNYNPTPTPTRPNGHRHPSNSGSEASSTVGTYFSQGNTSSAFPVFSSTQTPMTTLPDMPFAGQQSPVSPSFGAPSTSQMGSISLPQAASDLSNFTPAWDPSNPAFFNFNLDGLNFGSQYAAMEFSMLQHMSGNTGETPPRDPSISQASVGDVGFNSANVFGNGLNQQVYDTGMLNDFLGLDQSSNGPYSQGNLQHGLPHAYAIAAGPTSLQSPSTENNSPQPTNLGYEGSPTTAFGTPGASKSIAGPPRATKSKAVTSTKIGPQAVLGKRRRDASAIYDKVTEPYRYVNGFHRLIASIQSRFSQANTLRIAKSLSSIRPSFISCTKTLDSQDLVFMEKCFQRSLFEYEDFMLQSSSPAIVCRRTGEIAAVNKEFTALTGWSKEVLLGKEPNLNVNTGFTSGTVSNDGSGRAGLSTPRLKSLNAETIKASEGKPQPLFIAELMDDESVVEFYEDYAQLAFGDSRGSVRRKCRLLKYRTQELLGTTPGDNGVDESPQKIRAGILSNRVARIDGEHGISKIARGGKLECTYCWHIRRDTFDIPMMIVMNFLPCYYPNQEPHQLAV